MPRYKFIDLFAGIGGFHLAFHNAGMSCVFACEIDKYARKTYIDNFQHTSPDLFKKGNFPEDIGIINPDKIPDFNILCAGFPCQPFSQAGYKKGFQDEKNNRGNMFFEIIKVMKSKRPQAFFLENVRHLINHDDGRTFQTIEDTLYELEYSFYYKKVKASEYGLPQHRPRVFMVGFDKKTIKNTQFEIPDGPGESLYMSDIFGEPCNKAIGYTLRVGGKSSGINDRRNWDTYMMGNGQIRKIKSKEGKKMQGFPTSFSFENVSETQAMKQLGNSVAVPAVEATAKLIKKKLDDHAG